MVSDGEASTAYFLIREVAPVFERRRTDCIDYMMYVGASTWMKLEKPVACKCVAGFLVSNFKLRYPMKKEEDVEIEFEGEDTENATYEADGKFSDVIVRDVFRVPVDDSYGVNACFGSRRYCVVNLSKRGVAIRLLKGQKPFGIGDVLPSIELTLPDRVLNLRGKVVYVSYDEKEYPICGVNFLDLDEESDPGILEFYQHLRKEMFSKL